MTRRRLPATRVPVSPAQLSSRTCAPYTSVALATALAVLALSGRGWAATPYTEATVTRLQNDVSLGDATGKPRRAAKSGDVVKASNYLLTNTDSRAELKYPDGSIVRVGQNTVFTFEADTRTLSLQQGSLLFYIPKGSGGGTIRTGSLTAAITGTIGKVADNIIAILEGEVTLQPSGQKVGAGYFAQRNADGTITVQRFDPTSAMGGKLMEFGGPIADFDESQLIVPPGSSPNDIVRDIMREMEIPDRMQNHPGAQKLYTPTPKPIPDPKEEKKPPLILRRATPKPSPSRTPL